MNLTNVEHDVDRLRWFLVITRSRSEQKVATALRAKGFDVFLPMNTVRKTWSDRVKVAREPLFACNVFCRCSRLDHVSVVQTPGVFSLYLQDSRPAEIPAEEIDLLQSILEAEYDIERADSPQAGDTVHVKGNEQVRGTLVERGNTCRVAICLDSIGRVISIRIPLSDIELEKNSNRNIYIPVDFDA